jgi:hypothetical protein
MGRVGWVILALAFADPSIAAAQSVTQRGFVDARTTLFPQDAANDRTNLVVDLTAREEVFATVAPWLRLAAGLDARLNSHRQADRLWRLDVQNRGTLRPALSLRRLTATISRGPLTVDAGKQFIRWGTTDILTPTDRFAPRDFVNVIDADFLSVTGVRTLWRLGGDTIDVVWVPVFTPSRLPLVNQRWTVLPDAAAAATFHIADPSYPTRGQAGARWSHAGSGYEYSLSFVDGLNHLPDVDVVPGSGPLDVTLARRYPALRMYGGDAAVPTRWATLKGEAAFFSSSDARSDEYVLYVVQAERQTGEWLLLVGYTGEAITRRGLAASALSSASPASDLSSTSSASELSSASAASALLPGSSVVSISSLPRVSSVAPDRGLTRAIVARASYTIDSKRSIAVESAIRQNGKGVYAKGEYAWTRGQHWRTTLNGAVIRGAVDDFLGQYRRNSHVQLALRYSF